jgi:hypothetical protein
LDGRHRDTTGRIDKKHGNTRVGSLRKTYGEHFAKGRRKDMMLKTLLAETGTDSSRLSAQAPQVAGRVRFAAVRGRRDVTGLPRLPHRRR